MWFIFRRSRKMNHLFFCRCASQRHVTKWLQYFNLERLFEYVY
ncbi:MAG: hypothetical protein U5L45_18815 [Saprospiraceae bacterium]|nr:hypothetical protein [Saprospiraceae bacterium]